MTGRARDRTRRRNEAEKRRNVSPERRRRTRPTVPPVSEERMTEVVSNEVSNDRSGRLVIASNRLPLVLAKDGQDERTSSY